MKLIELNHLGLSGYSTAPYEESAERLIRLYTRYSLKRIVVWDLFGNPNETMFHPGSDFSDTIGVIEFDFAASRWIMCAFEITLGRSLLKVVVTLERFQGGTSVDGVAPLHEVLPEMAEPLSELRHFGNEVATIAEHLHVSALSVTNEYDERTLDVVPIAPPALLLVCPQRILTESARARLASVGAVVENDAAPFATIWVKAPELIVAGEMADEVVLASIVEFLERSELSKEQPIG